MVKCMYCKKTKGRFCAKKKISAIENDLQRTVRGILLNAPKGKMIIEFA